MADEQLLNFIVDQLNKKPDKTLNVAEVHSLAIRNLNFTVDPVPAINAELERAKKLGIVDMIDKFVKLGNPANRSCLSEHKSDLFKPGKIVASESVYCIANWDNFGKKPIEAETQRPPIKILTADKSQGTSEISNFLSQFTPDDKIEKPTHLSYVGSELVYYVPSPFNLNELKPSIARKGKGKGLTESRKRMESVVNGKKNLRKPPKVRKPPKARKPRKARKPQNARKLQRPRIKRKSMIFSDHSELYF